MASKLAWLEEAMIGFWPSDWLRERKNMNGTRVFIVLAAWFLLTMTAAWSLGTWAP